MKNIILYLLFIPCFFLSQSNAEEKKITENFINEVYSDFIPDDFYYYYLKDNSINLNPTFFENDQEIIMLNDNFSHIKELQCQIKTNKIITHKWSQFNLEKMRICSEDSIKIAPENLNPRNYVFTSGNNSNKIVLPNSFLVRIKSKWTREKKEREAEKQWNNYVKNYNYQDSQCYGFSYPIFFNNGKFAFIIFQSNRETIYRVYESKNNVWLKKIDLLKTFIH